ncbi:MAG: hypothetical protein OXN83_05645 [Oligoflexia bacterium]|nr:hypothetical protein [Oligoflexia bacterium]
MGLFSFSVTWLIFLTAQFSNIQFERSLFSFFKKQPIKHTIHSPLRKISSQGNYLDLSENKWKNVSLFQNSDITLYQLTENPNILISVKKGTGVSIHQISNLNHFFNQVEEEKLIALAKTSIKNRQVSLSKIERINNTALFYTKGTYADFQQKTVFFEDFSCYHKETSLHILVHNIRPSTKSESQIIYSFINDVIHSEPSLASTEKKECLSLTDQIKNNVN